MSKIKIMIGLATCVCAVMAVSAPAGAWFSSSGGTSGAVASFPATSTFTQGTGLTVECKNSTTTKATGFWTIQNATETLNEVTHEITQPATKEGPHEAITVQKWGACTATVLGSKFAAEVKECRLQVAQPVKSTGTNQAATGSVQTVCTVKVPGANNTTITIEPIAANKGLTTVTLNPLTGGVEIKANVTGITEKCEPAATCSTGGIPSKSSAATFSTGSAGAEAIKTAGQVLA